MAENLGVNRHLGFWLQTVLESQRLRSAYLAGQIRGPDLSRFNLDRAWLDKTVFNHGDFTYTRLRRANAMDSWFDHADFTHADLSDASFFRSSFQGSIMDGTILNRARFVRASFFEVCFKNVVADSPSFERANLHLVSFVNSTFTNANFKGANLISASFLGVDLVRPRYLAFMNFPEGMRVLTNPASDRLYAVGGHEDGLHFQWGCFFGTRDSILNSPVLLAERERREFVPQLTEGLDALAQQYEQNRAALEPEEDN